MPAEAVVEEVASVLELGRVAGPLESSHGAFLSMHRLTELERDPRFLSSYLLATARGEAVAAICLYHPKGPITDPAYDTRSMYDSAGTKVIDAQESILIGGRADRAAGLLTSSSATERDVAIALNGLSAAVRQILNAGPNRRGVALYLTGTDITRVGAIIGRHRLVQLDEYSELTFAPGVTEHGFLANLTASQRAIVRRDWRNFGTAGLESFAVSWNELSEAALPLIGNVLSAHALPTEPRLIQYRLAQWAKNPEITPVAFGVIDRNGQLVAASFGWVWRDWFQMYEVGLSGPPSPTRHLAYVEALLYAPLRYAWSAGCIKLTLGIGASTPKRLRGATMQASVALIA